MIPGIKPEKLSALIAEGFSEDYLHEIMKFKPSPENPAFDLNSMARQTLGLDCEMERASVSMTNWDVSAIQQLPSFAVIPECVRPVDFIWEQQE